MNNLDTVIIDHLIRLSPNCANTLMRLNKTINHRITSNKSLMNFLVQYFKNQIEIQVDEQLKRIFHIYSQPNKIIGIVNTKNNKYSVWFNGQTYKFEYDFIESESSRDGIITLSKLKDYYSKIFSFEKQNNVHHNIQQAIDKSICDLLDDFLLSLPVKDHFNGLLNTTEFLAQFSSLLIMFVIGIVVENKLSSCWLPMYIIVVSFLLIVLSYYHLYIKNRQVSFLS
jgi:hypothetical protein